MLIKTRPDEIQSFLADASHMHGGYAARVVFPENATEVADLLAEANASQTPVTVSGAGTGTVGGRVPFGGIVLATDRLNRIKQIVHENDSGTATAEAGVILNDLQRAVDAEKLFYPPDPTESSCFFGGTIATNASGARTFKYGPTRTYIRRLKVVLANGDVIDLRRGEVLASSDGLIGIPTSSAKTIEARLPSYQMPHTRKHAAGYFNAPRMDALDLFIGSEGTLGVIVEAEVGLLPKPEGLLSGVVFFATESDLLSFVAEARARSLANRDKSPTVSGGVGAGESAGLDARALEYFDA